jgi:hypothetical protein
MQAAAPPVSLSPEEIEDGRAAAGRLATALDIPPPAASADADLDWPWLRAERDKAWRAFLADVDGPDFRAAELRGCVRGWKSAFAGATAYGVGGRFLDWALELPAGPERDRALGWVRTHSLHVARNETFCGAADGLPRVSGEAGPYSHATTLAADPIPRDTDLLRHWCLEPFARAVLEPAVPFSEDERDEARKFVLGWGLDLLHRTPVVPMAVTNVFYEGAHSRLWFSADNLTWAYLATGHRPLLERAEDLVAASLATSQRAPGTFLRALYPCWAGSDPIECGRALGNPNAAHRAASAWHVGDSGRRALPLYVVSRRGDVRELIRRWVLVQTDLALRDGNPILRGGELRPSGVAGNAAEGDPAPWALLHPREALGIAPGASYQVLAGVPNWVHDGDYHSAVLEDGRKRYRYSGVLGVMTDATSNFGWADLFWTRFLVTGEAEDRLRALVCLRDRLCWANRTGAGPKVIVKLQDRTGWPYGGGNVSRTRSFAWAAECGSLIPWSPGGAR